MRRWLAAAAASMAAILGGCSTVNDGSTELRQWRNGDWDLLRPEAGLKGSDRFSITLHKAFIRDFQEWPVSKNSAFTGRGPFVEHGEIAILVKATESGATEKPARSTDPTKNFDGHRLVYYSDDVYQDQFLQFEMAPVWGPGKVTKGALKLEFVILELDRTSAQTEALLTALADLGQTQAAASGPLGAALLQLGQTLITSSHDDRQMRFEVVFDFETGPMPLRMGQYFLVRSEKRGEPMTWDKVCANPTDGLLYKRVGKACGTEQFRDDTYLSLVVAPRGEESLPFPEETFADLTAQLRNEQNPTLTRVQEIVGHYAITESERVNHGRLMTDWRQIELATSALADAKAVRPPPSAADPAPRCAPAAAADPALAAADTMLTLRAHQLHSDLLRMKDYAAKKAAYDADPKKPAPNLKDAVSASDFQSVARQALLYLSDPAVKVDETLDLANVGAKGAFQSAEELKKKLVAKADREQQLAIKQDRCRSAI